MQSCKLLKHKIEKFHLSSFWILSSYEKGVLLKTFLLEMRSFNSSHRHLMLFTERRESGLKMGRVIWDSGGRSSWNGCFGRKYEYLYEYLSWI